MNDRYPNALGSPPDGRERRGMGWLLANMTGGRVAYLGAGEAARQPRYGFGAPPHAGLSALLERGIPEFAALLNGLSEFIEDFRRIPRDRTDAFSPFWTNGWLPPIDAATLYSLVVRNNPARYIEIGSGNSTKFVRRAIKDHGLRTRVISIDPMPRAEIDQLCDRAIRQPFENVADSELDQVVAGDIVFVDGSHRVLMNSDVTVFFLDTLPALPAGALVQFHDIWLPFDYPQRWRYWYFSEQYLLASLLLNDGGRFAVRFPSMFASVHPELSRIAERIWKQLDVGPQRHGGSFWLELGRNTSAM